MKPKLWFDPGGTQTFAAAAQTHQNKRGRFCRFPCEHLRDCDCGWRPWETLA